MQADLSNIEQSEDSTVVSLPETATTPETVSGQLEAIPERVELPPLVIPPKPKTKERKFGPPALPLKERKKLLKKIRGRKK